MGLTQRVEELVPGSWFRSAVDDWQTIFSTWKRKHGNWKENSVRDRGRPGWRQKSAKENGSKKPSLKPNAKAEKEMQDAKSKEAEDKKEEKEAEEKKAEGNEKK